jgi:hypothetical protein
MRSERNKEVGEAAQQGSLGEGLKKLVEECLLDPCVNDVDGLQCPRVASGRR